MGGGGGWTYILFIIFAFSAVRCPTWFPDILGNIGLIACMGLLLVMIAL